MQNKLKAAIWVFMGFGLALLANACVEEFWPDLGEKYDKLLVVDGLITDQPGPYTISLSLSSGIDNPELVPVTGFEVMISDNMGNQEILVETEYGIYQTMPDGLQGVIGRKYQLTLISPEGKNYQSGMEELRLPVGIDNVYAELQSRQVNDLDHDLVGYQFYVDTYRAETDTNYFLWRLEETFKYNANHTLKYIFDGQMHPAKKYDSLYTCWKTDIVRDIFVYSTENLTEPLIKKFPLNFVSTETKEISLRYSLLVNQYSITKQAYEFWNQVNDLKSDQSGLFAVMPYQIRGNMIAVENSEEPVLGYFMAASISNKRVFVDKPTGVKFYYLDACNLYTEEIYTLLYLDINNWPLLLTTEYSEGGLTVALPGAQWCIDCKQEYDGTITPPVFWID